MMKVQLYGLCLLGALAGCTSTVSGDIVRDNGGGDDNEITGTDTPPAPADAPAAPVTPVTPTASTWLGINADSDLPRVDITYQLVPFDTAAAQKDANGYPVAGASGTSSSDVGFLLPSGTYAISYKGTGTLTVSGIGSLQGNWQTDAATGEHRGMLAITGTPGSFGHFLTLAIANTTDQTVTDIHIYLPGVGYDPANVFTPQIVALLAPFRAIRFMDWQATNGSTIADWSDRPQAAHFGHAANGEPYEHIVELINVTGKDMWICVPEHASDAFIQSMAEYLFTKLDMDRINAARAAQGVTAPFQVIVENSNETWNSGFTAYNTFLTAANADTRFTGVYDGTYGPSWMTSISDLMKVGQYEGDRLVKIGNAFRQAFGARSNQIAPVLSGWALGAGYSDVALRFIRANYGDPKNYVTYVAMAPYFGADDAQTDTLDHLFAGTTANIQSMDTTFADFARLVSEYGVSMAAYEGGQGFGGTTNQTIKHLAQHDRRMYDAYTTYYTSWRQHFGTALFMHFVLAGTPGLPENIYQYGYWGAIIGVMENTQTCGASLPTLTGSEAIASVVHHCPKYQALAEQALNSE